MDSLLQIESRVPRHSFEEANRAVPDSLSATLTLSLANGINNKGQVVGFSPDANSNNTVASLWQDGVLTDLNTLIPSNSPMFLIEALGINDRGQIAGYGLLSNGEAAD